MTALLEVRDLRKYFPVRGGLLRRVVAQVKAVDGVSFTLEPGRTLGLVGESGCGKSTLGRAILRLHKPTGGQVLLDGRDLATLGAAELTAMRRDMQIIFQDPFASLSPRRTVAQIIREPLDVHGIGTPAERARRVLELLDVVGMRAGIQDRYPHEFSGGQRQRIGIARALALNPKLIVADEPVSALDVSVRSQVLNLIAKLQRERGIAFLFISHDLSVVRHVSDQVGVMYLGRLVELADKATLFAAPRHPYTRMLLDAIPDIHMSGRSRTPVQGEVPNPLDPPPGCAFHPRCPHANARCASERPAMKPIGGIQVACHAVEEGRI